MQITLDAAGKRYRTDWIFRNLTFHFEEGGRYAIIGPNGSGKSTLLRILSGHTSLSKGKIVFNLQNTPVPVDKVFRHIAYAAPYIELIEEFTLNETIQFHAQFKSFINNLSPNQILDRLELRKVKNREIKFFSSGMKQRVKLGLSIISDCPILLLDEPSTNLDQMGVEWYNNLIDEFGKDRLIIVASNVSADYHFCKNILDILNYKKR